MNLTTIIGTLDNNLNRRTLSTKNNTNITTWNKNTTFTTTYNTNNTITNCKQICLQNTTNGIKVHINHHNRHKITTIGLDDITSLTIT